MKIFNKNFDTATKEANLKTRRILKGTLPPKNAENTGGISNSKDDDDDGEDERHVLLVPLQQSEELEDKKEKLRKERLSLSSKVRKQHKEKELMEHRLRSGSVSSSSKNKSEEMENKENLPQFKFSVESKFPEHKRKNRGSEVGKGKKLRSDSSELPEDESKSRSRIGIIAAVAVLAIIATKFMRK